MSEILDFRLAHEGDLSFVVDSWLTSYRGAHAAGMIRMTTWHSVMKPEVEAVLARPGVEVRVAYCPQAPAGDADLYGWVCFEPEATARRVTGRRVTKAPLIHYLYVKQTYRRSGVARGLLGHIGIWPKSQFLYSCKTGIVAKLLDPRSPSPKYSGGQWSPLIVRYPKEEMDEAIAASASGIR